MSEVKTENKSFIEVSMSPGIAVALAIGAAVIIGIGIWFKVKTG